MKCSVVLTTFNDSEGIDAFLRQMVAQSRLPDEIVIADGGSRDDTVKLIEEFGSRSPVRVILDSGKRLNIAQGYNVAIRKAHGDVFLLVGVGNRYATDYVESMCSALENGDSDICYSLIRGSDESEFAREYNRSFLNGESGLDIHMGSNHGALVRRSVFEKVGLFYEQFFYAGEDGEFYNRVKAAGLKSTPVPSAVALWDVPSDEKSFLRQIRVYTIAQLQFCSRLYIGKMFLSNLMKSWKTGLRGLQHRNVVLNMIVNLRYAFGINRFNGERIPRYGF